MNDRLLHFIRYNNILFQMVDFTHQVFTFNKLEKNIFRKLIVTSSLRLLVRTYI